MRERMMNGADRPLVAEMFFFKSERWRWNKYLFFKIISKILSNYLKLKIINSV